MNIMRQHLMSCESAGKEVNEKAKTASEFAVAETYIMHMTLRHTEGE